MRNTINITAGLIALSVLASIPATAADADKDPTHRFTLRTNSAPVLVPPQPGHLPPALPQPGAGMREDKGPLDRLKDLFGLRSPTGSQPVPVAPSADSDRVYYLRELTYRTARHTSPDALVFVKKGFDPTKPVVLLIHNHGLQSNVVQEFAGTKIQDQIDNTPQNGIYIMPEWATDPSSKSTDSGPFNKPGFFKSMLLEIFSKTDPLHNLSMDNISDIYVTTFAGGFRAAATEIARNGLEEKIRSVTLLDSARTDDSSEKWLKTSLKDFKLSQRTLGKITFSSQTRAQSKKLR